MRRRIGLAPAIVVASCAAFVACGDDAWTAIGDAMVDAGGAMVDAGGAIADAGDASAQGPLPPAVGVPVGTVVAFAGPVPPEGWLPCDGTELDRDEYAELFTVLGTAHGSGNGASTFHLPDYRGRFLRGADAGAGIDPEAGAREAAHQGGNTGDRVGSVQAHATALPNAPFAAREAGDHAHDVQAIGSTSYSVYNASDYARTMYVPTAEAVLATTSAGRHTHAIDGGDAETRPVNAAVLWIVRARAE